MFQESEVATLQTFGAACAENPALDALVHGMREYSASQNYRAAAVVIPGELIPVLAGASPLVLLVMLPDFVEKELSELLSGDADIFNVQSDDLLKSTTVVRIGDDGRRICFESNQLIGPALGPDFSVVVVAVSGESVCRRHLVPEDDEVFMGGLQGAEGSSGVNYRPYCIYSDEELAAAALSAQMSPTRESQQEIWPVPLTYNLRDA